MSKPNVKDLPAMVNFIEERQSLEKDVLRFDSLTGRSNLFLSISRLYKTVAEKTQDEEAKKNAINESEYFLNQAVKYGKQYEIQKEMLPEMFKADKPIELQ